MQVSFRDTWQRKRGGESGNNITFAKSFDMKLVEQISHNTDNNKS